MDFPMIDETQNYISFCKKANLPINEVPEKGKPMELTYEVAMKAIDPHLYERLTVQGKLKADVLDRHLRQAYWTTDVAELEAKGYTGVAANLKAQMVEGRRQIEANKLKEILLASCCDWVMRGKWYLEPSSTPNAKEATLLA